MSFNLTQTVFLIFILINLVFSILIISKYLKKNNISKVFIIHIICVYSFPISILFVFENISPIVITIMYIFRFAGTFVLWILVLYAIKEKFQFKKYYVIILFLKITLQLILSYPIFLNIIIPTNLSNYAIFLLFISIFINYTFVLMGLIVLYNGYNSSLIKKGKLKKFKATLFTFLISVAIYLTSLVDVYVRLNLIDPLIFYTFYSIILLLYSINLLYIKKEIFEEESFLEIVNQKADSEEAASLVEFMRSSQIFKKEGLTIKMLAELRSMKEHQLRNLINYGLSFNNFNDFINKFRIEEACTILDDSTNKVKIIRIAMDVGFDSLTTFYRVFAEQMGMSPSQYKKRHKQHL